MANAIGYTFVPAVETTRPSGTPRTSSGTAQTTNPIAYGNGVLAPFVRDGRGDFAHASDITLVRSEVRQVLGTLASSAISVGELPWRPEFGSVLPLLRFRNMDETTIELARTYVVDALKVWLRRVQILDATITADHDAGVLTILVAYNVLANNNRSVLVPNVRDSVDVPITA